jgi:hypothetical protein
VSRSLSQPGPERGLELFAEQAPLDASLEPLLALGEGDAPLGEQVASMPIKAKAWERALADSVRLALASVKAVAWTPPQRVAS